MCATSFVMDHYYHKWKPIPGMQPYVWPTYIYPYPVTHTPTLTEEEIEDLRKLLERAKKYDEETDQKDCELVEKKKKLRELAAELGAKVEFLE